jgi:1-acyl-sn-glycerol-3-phosphate acyltransferase
MKILERHPVPVVPLALHNLWGSFFSRADGNAMRRPLRRGVWNRVALSAGAPLPARDVTPDALRQRVRALLGA